MKRQTFMKSTLCLLMALVCNVAWADFTQQWTGSPVAPWSATAEENVPDGVAVCKYGDDNSHTIHMAETEVKTKGGTLTVDFTYTKGTSMLMIAGVDLVANGTVVKSDYHEGKAGGEHLGNGYTLENVPAGDYTLRYFVCQKTSGSDNHNLAHTNGTITVTGADRPIVGSTAENKIFYNIKNVRSGKYANYEGAGAQFTQVATPTLGSYWYLMEVADAKNVPAGYKAYYLYNAGNTLAVENPGTGYMSAPDADPVTDYPAKIYCIGEHTEGNVTGIVIRALGEDGASWNDANGSGTKIANHGYKDPGSIWTFERVDVTESQLIQNAVAVKTGVLNTLATEVTNTQRYHYGYALSDIEAKKAEIEAISIPETSLADALTGAIAISKMTPLAGLERVAPKAGDKFIMDNKGRDGRLTAFAAGSDVKCLAESSPFAYFDAVWTLVATETEGQFKLYNEKMNVYVGVLSDANNTRFQYVTGAEEAGVYELANVEGYATFKKVGGDNNSHLHQSNWGGKEIVRWDNGDCSQWQLVKAFGPELTTDANNPICYALKSGRDGNYYFTLDNNKVKLFNNKAVATDETTHWYFMLDESGNLKMYSKSDNKAMGYLKGTDGATKLTNDPAATDYDSDTYTLYFAPYNQTDYNGAWFALKPSRGDTYVSNHGGTGNYMGFYNNFNDGGTRIAFEPIVTITYTLSDNAGNQFTGTYQGFAGVTLPTINGAYTLSNEAWSDGNTTFTATITFPFPVSSESVTNATMISSFKEGNGGAVFKWYATDDNAHVKVQKNPTVTVENLKSYSWAIYPSLKNGAFVFSIKNVAANKYIHTEASYVQNEGSHNDANTISLTDTPTEFMVSTDGESRFYYVGSNNQNQYLSYGSTSTENGYLGVYAREHNGTTNSFYDAIGDLTSKDQFVSGGVYTFVTSRGWVGANEGNTAIGTVKTSVTPAPSNGNIMFQWALYQSRNGNYYLYNLGKQKFLGVPENGAFPFVDTPTGKNLTFKENGDANYPIMFSADNKSAVSQNANAGLFAWEGGWNKMDDAGSNHKVTYIGELDAEQLKTIADLVEAYDKSLPFKVEVEGSWEGNPNTHFGNVTATAGDNVSTTKMTLDHMNVSYMMYSNIGDVVAHARPYRGFEFQGFYAGTENLGKSFTITEELVNSITAENPLIAKFSATEAVTLFYDDDPFPYRIPAIATTSTGRLIAVSDYRHCLDDIGLNRYGKGYRIDLVIRTSDDNGKTWSSMKTIAEGIDNSRDNNCAYGDAAIAVVGEEVIVMAVAGSTSYGSGTAEKTSRLVRIHSANNGEDWEKEDITEKVYGHDGALYPNMYTAFFGSGRLAVDPNFNNSGKARIYGSMLTQGMGNIVIYSDDMGKTWNKLGEGGQVANANEPKIEILPSGQILFSARRNGGRNFNVFTYTDKANNVGTWSNAVNGCDNEGQNGTNGETFLVDAKNARGENVKLLLQSQPVGGGAWDRANVSIWYKEISSAADHNHTPNEIANGWTKGMQVSQQLSAYSAMSLQKDGKIAFFFEEAPCFQDEYKYGYCMVYLPLTIEQITKNKYFSLDADLTTERNISVVLTDAQGNEYRKQITSALGGVADKLTTDYPFIDLGDNATLEPADGENFIYTNTVTLPFKVSNENTTVWHNIYWHGRNDNELVYLYGADADEYVDKVAPGSYIPYGASDYNTAAKADNMSWAVYHADNFTFTLKNKLTNKYIKVTGVASGNSQNATFVEEGATAFEIVTKTAGQNYKGDYSFKAIVDGVVGYLCNTSASYGWATHYTGNGHEGGWATIKEAPDFEALFAEVNVVLNMFGDGLGQYSKISDENLAAVDDAKTAMQTPSSVNLSDLNEYKNYTSKTEGGTLNLPKDGQFFRIRGISGNYIDASSIYNNANATTGQMSMKSAEECNYNGTIFYLDEAKHLLNYATGTYVKQTREIGAVGDSDKGVWNFTESTRNGVKGKYLLQCTVGSTGNGQHLHDNSGNRADRCSSNCGERHDFTLEEVTELPFNISSVGYGTLYAPVALEIPAGIKAYTGVLNADQNELVLTRVKDIIPAETAVVLYRDPQGVAASAEATTHNFKITSTTETVEDNALEGGVATIATATATNPYTLQTSSTSSTGVAFKKFNGVNITGFKAYLPFENAQQAQSLRIRFAGEQDDDATEIEMPVANGQQPIAIYDLTGRRVEKMEKGIYIVNGRKVVIK